MFYNGVKYYSNNDFSIGENLKQAEKIINSNQSEINYSCNQILEFYNVVKLMESGVRLNDWDDGYYNSLKTKAKFYNERIGRFFSNINDENIEEHLDNLCYNYYEDFFELFNKRKCYEYVSSRVISALLDSGKIPIHILLVYKATVNYYGDTIREYLINNPKSAELLISCYLEKDSRKYYFPNSLTGEDKEGIIISYIDSTHPHPNYLELLSKSNPSGDFPYSDKTKLKARRVYKRSQEDIFDRGVSHSFGTNVAFSENQIEEKIERYNNSILEVSYSTSYLSSTLDYASILNNFIYLFEYTDIQFRSAWYQRKADLGLTETVFGVRGKTEYKTGISFMLSDMLSLSQITGYSKFLNQNDVFLERVLKWFFEEYLKEEFSVSDFKFNIPTENSSYLEKCKLLLIELDSILKQFKYNAEDGTIDWELLKMSSKHVKFDDIQSRINNKYIYLNEEKAEKYMYLLFSDQSGIYYTEKYKTKYNSFAKLIFGQDMYIIDFKDFQKQRIDVLKTGKIIEITEDGLIIPNKDKIVFLYDLYKNEVSRYSYMRKLIDTFDSQEQEKYFYTDSTLFSKPEQSYLNFMLNNAEFSNGYELRNKYIHGTSSDDEATNEKDYYQILKIFVFVIIKINEEFCESKE